MAKRQRLPSSEEEGDAAASSDKEKPKKEKKDKKDKKGKEDKEEKKKDKEKKEKKEDKQEKKEEKQEKKEDKKDKKGKEKATKRPYEGPEAPDDGKKKKKDKKDKEPATKAVTFPGGGPVSRDSRRPFGLELDGALVVDLADKGSEEAMMAGVSIGWRVLSVNGQPVPEEDEGVAARRLRDAEVAASKSSSPKADVVVQFMTEEPDHWKQAAKNLAGRRH
eukprot:TRINITY_DN9318_c0_g1_i1.p1 TRINITY_DN9318_c0_g1~~TRINITY_DN9318_c0_g1_i1.p1  ORF type:complete len:220 (+),score=93.41 TRINITY_DN9318_c0_g1_i1:79-738(+)